MLFVFRCNLKLLKPIFFFELILVCGSEVTKKFSVRVRERDDNTDPTLSSNEREGLSCLSPPMRGIRRRRHKQRVEAEKNFECSLSFIFSFFFFKDGRHGHIKTSHRPFSKMEMFRSVDVAF